MCFRNHRLIRSPFLINAVVTDEAAVRESGAVESQLMVELNL